GLGAVAFRVNGQGELIAFAGSGAGQISIDGRLTVFADGLDLDVAWAPVSEVRRVPNGALLQVRVRSEGRIRIPVPGLPRDLTLVAEGAHPGSRGEEIPCSNEGGILAFTAVTAHSGRWLYALKA
ncbi:MAG: hypothetical protein ACRDG4_13730, partial [Chloroflexota bacterium]